MTRLERKHRTDIIFKGCGGLMDAFDDALKQTWRMSDDEYDYIAEFATDDELDAILKPLKTIEEKRNALIVSNKLITEFRNKN